MKKEITIGLITMVCGLFLGYLLKDYQDRPEPSIVIENIEFKQMELDSVPDVQIESDLQELSKQSQWLRNLEATISLSDLEEIINGDLDETVQELENMSLLIPKLIKFVQQNQSRNIGTREYRMFLAKEADALTLVYMTMNIAGAIQRGEFIPTQLAEQYPEAVASTSILLGRAKRGEWKLRELADVEKNKFAILALALISEWYPKDILRAAEVLQAEVPSQLVINQKMLKQLCSKYDSAKSFRYQEFVNVSASVVNSGDKTVSIDQYATLSLHGMNRKFFMVSDKLKGRAAIPPGEVRNIYFRSEQPLSKDESEKLKTLYETKILNCQLTMRIITEQEFTPRWLHSELTEFSGDKTKLRALFLRAAPVQ